ncbi:unnamed protein product, partial [Adineta steineri]
LVRGEPGHDIVPELYPLPGEPIIDKCGKGAFYATDLDAILKNYNIKQLIVTGVTTEVCVSTTVREANDRGYECLVLEDCVGSYFEKFQVAALDMIKAQGGDKYTFAFNMASLSQIVLCPIVGFCLAFRAEKNPKQKLLNASIVQTCAWILNIIACIICMFVKSTAIIPALIFNYIGRSVIVASSQAVISTFFPSEYIGRLTGIMWTSAGVITCIQYGLVHLTTDVSQSWRAWVIVLILIIFMACHLIQTWFITFKKFRKNIQNVQSDVIHSRF